MGNGHIPSIGDSQCLVDLLVDAGFPRTLNIHDDDAFGFRSNVRPSSRDGKALSVRNCDVSVGKKRRLSGIADIDDLQARGIGDEQVMKLQLGCSRVVERNDSLNHRLKWSLEIDNHELLSRQNVSAMTGHGDMSRTV